MAAEQTESTTTDAARGRGRLLPVVIVVILMGAEGVGVFILARIISPGPVAVVAADVRESKPDGVAPAAEELAEVELAECRPSNMMTGKLVAFHIRVTGLVASEDRAHVEELVRSARARLEHAVNTVIRGAEPQHFNEPELATLSRRLKHKFDEVFGDDQLIKKVLIPHLLQSGTGV